MLLLIVASIWYFKFYKKPSNSSLTGLVPLSSVGIINSTNPERTIDDLSKYAWWNSLQEIPFFKNSLDQLQIIQGLIDDQQLQSKLNQLEHTISLHITANDQIETLHFVSSNTFSWSQEAISQTIKLIWPKEEPKVSERTYEGLTLKELKLGGQNYAFIIISDYLIYSTNAILVEDVIRTALGITASLFDSGKEQLNANGGLSLILNTSKLDDLERVFFLNSKKSNGEALEGLLNLEMNASEGLINFNGLIRPTSGKAVKKEIGLNEKDYLPNELSNVSVSALPTSVKTGNELENFDLEAFLNLHQGSITEIEMDAGGQEKQMAIVATIDNRELVQSQLDRLSLDLSRNQNDTLYQEVFMNAAITFLNKKEITTDFYGAGASAFEQCYYAVYNNVLVLGESVDIVKLILKEYDDENTWGKIVTRRRFLDDLIQETVHTRLINFQFSVDALKEDLKPKWKTFFEERQQLLDLIDLVVFQMTSSGNGYYTSTQVSLNPLTKSVTDVVSTPKESDNLNLVSNAFSDLPITSRPYVVRNHNDGGQEIFFQDANNDVYLISKEGTLVWKKSIGQKINGSVNQIDFYNNRKLQYLFVTDSAIHLMDRNGDNVENFPRPINTELPLLNATPVDYDNSKRYRYLTYDRRGNAYLFDKNGGVLEGWNPRRGGVTLADLPKHIRVRGKDCFVFVRQDGTIELTNRRGELYEGFPFKVGKRLAGDVKLSKGPDFNRTLITVSSIDGQQLSINLNGTVQARSQLFKPSVESKFELISDKLGTDHIVIRKDSRGTVFFDSKGEELFSSELVLEDADKVSFYNFRNESEIYLINAGGQLHILDKSGTSKLDQPVGTDFEVGLVYYQSRGEYELFINFENQFAVYKFSK